MNIFNMLANTLKNGAKQMVKDMLKKLIFAKFAIPVAVVVIFILFVAIIAGTIADGENVKTNVNSGYTSVGTGSMFYDESFTKEEFIDAVKKYNPPNATGNGGRSTSEYYEKCFVNYAEDYFDISVQYGYDPRVTFCTGIQESYFGTSNIAYDKCNYWGIGAVDGDAYNSAYTFTSIPEGIKELCNVFDQMTQKKEGNEKYFWKYDQIIANGYDPTTIDGVGSLYASDGSWATQKKTHMKNIFGWVESTSGNIDSSSFLSTAKGVWQQVCNRFTTYGGTSIVPTGTTIDCSSYVSWVLYEYGYSEFEGGQKTTLDFYNTNWNKVYGWTEINVALGENPNNKLQPGDIFVRYNGTIHHVLIYVGPGESYDCGATSNWTGKKGSPCNFVDMLTGERSNAPGKIIRVTKPKQ